MSIKSTVSTYCPFFLRSAFDRIANSPIGYRLASGMFWLMVGAVISRVLMLVAMILVARILGKTVYGELGMINSTIGMLGTFAGFGLGLTATKYIAEYRQSDPLRAGYIIGLSGLFTTVTGGLIAVGLFISAPWLAEHTLNAPHLSSVLRVAALILFVSTLNGAQIGALSGFEAFKIIAYINLFVGLISLPVLVAGVWFGGLMGAVWAMTINFFINWLFNHLALRKEARRHRVPFTFRHCTREISVLWKFSFPAVLSATLVGPVNWACGALLVNQPDGYGEMGIFSAANQWRIAILFIPNMLSQVVLPLLSNLNAESESQRYRKVLILNIILNTGISLAIVLPLVLFAHLVMNAYGPDFEQGKNVLRILAFTAVLMAANNAVGQAIISKGKMWIGFMFNILWAIALLTGTLMLLYNGYGALGLACATLLAYVLHTAWQSIYLSHVLKGKNGK